MTEHSNQQKNAKTVKWMFFLVVGMFGFGFAMVPLYSMLCSVTGLNGSTTGRVQESSLSSFVDTSRTITVQFDSTKNIDLPWEFYPMVKQVKVHPGEIKEVSYFVKNKSDKPIVAQAIPGITPWQATTYFNKTECFCFSQQTLQPGESREMALRFIVDTKLPEGLNTITLSYTFMDIDRTNLKNIPQLQGSL